MPCLEKGTKLPPIIHTIKYLMSVLGPASAGIQFSSRYAIRTLGHSVLQQGSCLTMHTTHCNPGSMQEHACCRARPGDEGEALQGRRWAGSSGLDLDVLIDVHNS